MAIELKMPALSPTMEKGTLTKWLVKEGDSVKLGDLLAEIEADKATMEFEAIYEGEIVSIAVPAGTDDVAVGTVIALIAEAGETVVPRVLEMADTASVALPPAPFAKGEAPVPAPVAIEDVSTINTTPLARRIATVKGLSLLGIAGTGAHGRIVKADLGLPSLVAAPVAAAAAPSPAAAPLRVLPNGTPMETVKLSGLRKTNARRLSESKQTVPHLYLTVHCRIDALLVLRDELNASLSTRGVRLSVNDLVIKAMALAMVREPDTNVQFADEHIYRFNRIDIAMAVAIDGGLITPVIRDVASLSLSAVAKKTEQLAANAREGKLPPDEYQGGTASISNLGMYGIDEIIPVINPPRALILAVGAPVEKPWKVDGGIALATIMSTTASFDHRAIDGAAAARFMAAFRNLIEQPMQIVC